MKTLRYMAAALAAAGLMAAPANAATFVFKGATSVNNVTPTNASDATCGSLVTPTDICNVEVGGVWQSLEYEQDGVDLTVNGYTGGEATRLIQDRSPADSGLGVWSEFGDTSADQTQSSSGEAIEFIFNSLVRVTDVEFNAGADTSCSNVTPATIEGTCGSFLLQVFDTSDVEIFSMVYDVTSVDMLAELGVAGKRFLLTALDLGEDFPTGFSIGQLTVNQVPVPAALPLLLSGLAGLGFASRRRKSA